jgi:uncharacterized membrane protein
LSNNRGIVFRPFSFLYFTILFVLYLLISPFFITFFRNLLVRGIGIPPETFGVVLFLSLFGSFVNIPLTTIETQAPLYTYKEIKFFRVTWRIPIREVGINRTRVSINLGGAIVPILISIFITFWNIPKCSPNLIITYSKLLFILILVALTTYRNSRIIKGLGIATPMLGPPLTTALTTIFVHILNPVACPTQISYVGGTLGTLIGADLMNLHKLPKLGAPMVSIGGAGTFDGIYLTGLISVLLVILLL